MNPWDNLLTLVGWIALTLVVAVVIIVTLAIVAGIIQGVIKWFPKKRNTACAVCGSKKNNVTRS